MSRLLQEVSLVNNVFDQYKKKVDEIALFIQVAEQQKAFVTKVKDSNDTSDYISKLKNLSNSVVLYNAAIISIYGSYELFLDEILNVYFEYIKRNKNYEDIPLSFNEKHFNRGVDYLSNPNRYQNTGLSKELVISALESTYIQKRSDTILFELVKSHGGNLKTPQLSALLKDFGFEESIAKLLNHRSFSKMIVNDGFEDVRNSSELYRLDRLVEERNKVGHGWIVDDRIAFSTLREDYLSFFVGLCESIRDLVISNMIQDSIERNEIEAFDSILHVWGKGKVIGINSKNFRLKVGEYLFCSNSQNWNYMIKITNLQNDLHNRMEIRTKDKDISIEVDHAVKENYMIWGFVRG